MYIVSVGGVIVRNRKKTFCFFMAIFMLLAGIGFENAKISSFLEYNTSDYSAEVIDSGSAITAFDAMISVNTTNLRAASQIRQISVRNAYSRRNLRLSYAQYFVEAYAKSYAGISKTVSKMALTEPYSQTVVLNYIHNTDGKKKI